MWESGTPIHSAIYDQPSSHCSMVIWLLARIAVKLIERKRGGTADHAADGEPPISQSSGLKALELFIQGRDFVREGRLRGLAPSELTSQ
jgi:hypothetical protein